MKHIYNSDWVIPILQDLEEFLTANNMEKSSRLVAEAAAAVRLEGISSRRRSAMNARFPGMDERGNVVPLQRVRSRD